MKFNVFISYTSKDEQLMKKVDGKLSNLKFLLPNKDDFKI